MSECDIFQDQNDTANQVVPCKTSLTSGEWRLHATTNGISPLSLFVALLFHIFCCSPSLVSREPDAAGNIKTLKH